MRLTRALNQPDKGNISWANISVSSMRLTRALNQPDKGNIS